MGLETKILLIGVILGMCLMQQLIMLKEMLEKREDK